MMSLLDDDNEDEDEKLTIYDVLFIRDTFHHVVMVSVWIYVDEPQNRKRCKIIKVNQIQGC